MTTMDRPGITSIKIGLVHKAADQHQNSSTVAALVEARQLRGPLVWDPATLESPQSYALQLSAVAIEEIDAALAYFKDLGLDGDKVCEANFPLPKLGIQLRQGASAIHNGRGLFLVRGLDPAKYSSADSVIIYLGISSYLADKRGVQNKRGDVLTHVTDSKLWTVPREKRHGIHSNQALPFHNDMGSDMLALQVREAAASGGGTYLSSAWSIYNDLLSTQPEALKELFTPSWPILISGKASRYILSPLMAFNDGRLMVCLDPGRLGPQPGVKSRLKQVPDLSGEQRAALGAFFESAKRHQIRVPLEAGDLLYFNNWALVHRREKYEDGTATSRHLVRLWLRNSRLGWKIPRSMATPWLSAYEATETIDRVYAIEPMPEYKTTKYSSGSAAFVIESEDEEFENDVAEHEEDM